MKTIPKNHQQFLYGKRLYGNDFELKEIIQWYNEEKEAYAELLQNGDNFYYESANYFNAFRYLPKNKIFQHVLGFGAADGYELIPIQNKINQVTIMDPSDYFANNMLNGKTINRFKPTVSGQIEFEEETFDLITCFGVLHHIPNVSFILKEFYRCLKKDGFILIREPINSMGDWKNKRKHLTKNERGIPLKIFREFILSSGFKIEKEIPFEFSPLQKNSFMKNFCKKNFIGILLDNVLASSFLFNYSYHATTFLRKIKPLSVYYILTK